MGEVKLMCPSPNIDCPNTNSLFMLCCEVQKKKSFTYQKFGLG